MTIVRFLHLAGMALFVGGQLALVLAVAPAMRRAPDDGRMREIAKRFGMASAVALVVIIATGIAMASHFHRWDDPVLHAKLGLLVAIFALTGVHVVRPQVRGLSLALLALSVTIAYLGVTLAHG